MSSKPGNLTTGKNVAVENILSEKDSGKSIIDTPFLGFVPILLVLQLNYQYHNLYRTCDE